MANLDTESATASPNEPPLGSASVRSEQVEWWHGVVDFLVHVFVGTSIFLIIAAIAVGLDILTQWVESQGSSSAIVFGLRGVEYLLFVADLALFVVFVLRTTHRSAKTIWAVGQSKEDNVEEI